MESTRLTPGAPMKVLLLALPSVLGVALGIFAPAILRWAAGLEWLPLEGPRILLGQLSSTVGSWILIVLGGIAGLILGAVMAHGLSTITVDEKEIVITKERKTSRFSRQQVAAALLDGNQLVLRDDRAADLIRVALDIEAAQVTEAMQGHGWPVST